LIPKSQQNMASQQSFPAVLNRFKDGNVLVQAWPDYSPGNPLIIKAALPPFILSVEAANDEVTNTETDLGTARGVRNPLVFEIKATNPACLEKRIRGIVNHQFSDPDNVLFVTAGKKINVILKKIRPKYPKKPPGTPRGSGNSPMEKSFASAVGHGRAVITIITKLGAADSPADANLSVVSMTTLVDLIEAENENVQSALEDYGVANRARLKLFKGPQGLEKRRSAILKYLSSFPGLTQSDHYIEYNQAIKGT
ncbi:MAG TPA: hypothetical protein VI757_01955, partial [Bacteroidia bacterium]|nr:hypothetical protein [Bacteroidia bacterium]